MITVIAGVNGAGKSSIIGETLRNLGADYVNPDELAKVLMQQGPGITQDAANAEAWQISFDILNSAIDTDEDFIFETTLGGRSVVDALLRAVEMGREIQIFYVGLASAELHIERVKARVERGGHPIPEQKIRERWENSRINLVSLIPLCRALNVFDNSCFLQEGKPMPVCLFKMYRGRFIEAPIAAMPDWAKPLAVAAIQHDLAGH